MPAIAAASQHELDALRRRVTTPASVGLLILRIGFATLLFVRGLAQAMHIDDFTTRVAQSSNPIPIGDSVAAWITVVGELGLPVLLLFGFLTRIAGALLFALMGLIYYSVHVSGTAALLSMDRVGPAGPTNGEPALMIGLVGLVLAFTGPGRIAIDHGFRRSREEIDDEPVDAPTPPPAGRPIQTRPDQPRLDQARPDQARPDQARPDQARPDQARPDQNRQRGDRPLPEDPKNWTDDDIRRL